MSMQWFVIIILCIVFLGIIFLVIDYIYKYRKYEKDKKYEILYKESTSNNEENMFGLNSEESKKYLLDSVEDSSDDDLIENYLNNKKLKDK